MAIKQIVRFYHPCTPWNIEIFEYLDLNTTSDHTKSVIKYMLKIKCSEIK